MDQSAIVNEGEVQNKGGGVRVDLDLEEGCLILRDWREKRSINFSSVHMEL